MTCFFKIFYKDSIKENPTVLESVGENARGIPRKREYPKNYTERHATEGKQS